MVSLATVEMQLKKAGCNFRYWGRTEIKELCHVLMDGEVIQHCLNGQYEGGFALLCATDRRVLLVDKKPRFLTLKDIRFEMITEMDFSHRIMNSTIRLFTPNKELRFTGYNHRRLRDLFHYVQHKVVETRQSFMQQQFQSPQLMMGNMANPAMLLQAQFGTQMDQAQLPEPPTFVPNGAQSRLAAFMGKMGVKGISHHHDDNGKENPAITATYSETPAFRGWRRRIAPYRF